MKTNNTEFYNHPFDENKNNSPYGKNDENGIYTLSPGATTRNRYGYCVKPIFGVESYCGDFRTKYYQIFVGECPHKDKSGKWVTYNNVPTFRIEPFGGSYYIDLEPSIPHIIRLETDESVHCNREKTYEEWNAFNTKISSLETKLRYCSFSLYLHGLCNRIKRSLSKVRLKFLKRNSDNNSSILGYKE